MRAICLLLLTSSLASAQQKPLEAQVQEKFSPGGFIRLHLSPGGYTITGGEANAILITYTAKNPEALKRVKARIRTSATTADVSVSDAPHNNFQATIEVPPMSDLRARMLAGEIVIDGVEGNKDVEVDYGRIEIKIPKPQELGSVMPRCARAASKPQPSMFPREACSAPLNKKAEGSIDCMRT